MQSLEERMNWRRLIAFVGSVLLTSQLAWSGNGHLLHGVGPWNSAMGGAGVALFQDSLAALHVNPALLTKVKGHQITLSSEFFVDGLRVESQVGNVFGGRTDATRQLGVIPSFSWMGHQDGKPVATGFGLLGVAGFRTDYPQDSSNFLLVPQPEGFGRIYTDLAITKIPLAFGFEVNPKLSLGVSLNVYRGVLAIQPLPVIQPDFSGDPAIGWLPGARNQVARFGIGVQFGFVYEPTPMVSVGASYISKQKFQQYEWNATIENPNLPTFGQHRRLEFNSTARRPCSSAWG
jgi:long-subunit fatty acid transport protein